MWSGWSTSALYVCGLEWGDDVPTAQQPVRKRLYEVTALDNLECCIVTAPDKIIDEKLRKRILRRLESARKAA